MLKLTIFHGSPCRAATTTATTKPASAATAPIKWLMLLKRSPSYMHTTPCDHPARLETTRHAGLPPASHHPLPDRCLVPMGMHIMPANTFNHPCSRRVCAALHS